MDFFHPLIFSTSRAVYTGVSGGQSSTRQHRVSTSQMEFPESCMLQQQADIGSVSSTDRRTSSVEQNDPKQIKPNNLFRTGLFIMNQ
jgi:hypothetical protein